MGIRKATPYRVAEKLGRQSAFCPPVRSCENASLLGFWLEAEAERDAITDAGVIPVGVAAVADTTEMIAVV